MEILDRLNIGMYRSDTEGNITHINDAGLRIYGRSSPEWGQMNTRDLSADQRDWSRIRAQVQEWGHVAAFVGRARANDGSVVFLEMSIRSLVDQEGTFLGTEGVFKDVTDAVNRSREQTALAASIQQANERLVQFSSLQEDLLFSLSHDLKTPPVVIQGFAELLLRGRYGALSSEQEKPVQTIYRNILSLSDMVDQLLDFSRMLRKVHAQPSPKSLVQAWNDVCEGFGRTGYVMAAFEPCEVHGPDAVRADHTGLAYALRNIAHNALRFARPGTAIACQISRDGAYVCLAVDIPSLLEDHPSLQRILDSLFQPASAAQAEAGLTGPGLAAGRYLATLMGGDLRCEEFPGDRGRILLRLPAARAVDEEVC